MVRWVRPMSWWDRLLGVLGLLERVVRHWGVQVSTQAVDRMWIGCLAWRSDGAVSATSLGLEWSGWWQAGVGLCRGRR